MNKIGGGSIALFVIFFNSRLSWSEENFKQFVCPLPEASLLNGEIIWTFPAQVLDSGHPTGYRSASAFFENQSIVSDSNGYYIIDRQFIDLCEGRRFSKIKKVTCEMYWFWGEGGKSLGPGLPWSRFPQSFESISPIIYPDLGEGNFIPCKNEATGELGYFSIKENIFIAVKGVSIAQEFHDGLALVREKGENTGKWYFIRGPNVGENGKVGGMAFDKATHFSEGLAAVYTKESGRWCWLNEEGETSEIKTAEGVDFIFPLKEGLAGFSSAGKYGYINRNGEIVLPLKFSEAASFSSGVACVSEDGKNFGYIDHRGNSISGYHFSSGGPCVSGFAYVTKNPLIDDRGLRRRPRSDEWILYNVVNNSFLVKWPD